LGKIADFLRQYSQAHQTFLEFVVTHKKLKIERFHTELAVLYLDKICEISDDDEEEVEQQLSRRQKYRQDLQDLIMESTCLRFPFLLSKMESMAAAELHLEKALISGKLGDDDKALKILVHKLKDYSKAEQYCDKISANSKDKQARLLTNLLAVYLDKNSSSEEVAEFSVPAMDLFSRRVCDMDTLEVLALIPDHWSIAAVSAAIQTALRSSIHNRRMTSIERSLAKADNLNAHFDIIQLTKDHVTLNENSYCMLCKKTFVDTRISRFPNGIIVHDYCAKTKSTCPVTGKVFF